jgi:hypothetical protein
MGRRQALMQPDTAVLGVIKNEVGKGTADVEAHAPARTGIAGTLAAGRFNSGFKSVKSFHIFSGFK